MSRQSIPCPQCSAPITIETNQLLMGESFTCSACNTRISLQAESQPKVHDAMAKLDALKLKRG